MKILIFGSCNIDTVYKVKHIVQPEETLGIDAFKQFLGGKGLNQSVALARAGVSVYYAGCIGEEDTAILSMMKREKIDTTYLKTIDEPTGSATIQVNHHGQNAILVYPGANGKITKEYIDEVLEDFEAGDILLVQNEISNTPYLIQKASYRGMRIILNPSPFTEELRKIDLNELYCVILNETEAMQWLHTEQSYEFISFVQKAHPQLKVVLTLGEGGSICLDKKKIYRQFAYKLPVADTTAAGDAFTGYFVAGLFKGEDIGKNLKIASAAASMTISQEGAATSIPKIKEVLSCMDSLALITNGSVAEQKEFVRSYIISNISNIRLSNVARLLGYSETHTGRWLQKNCGMSFSEFVQDIRCEMAADLLENSHISIEKIMQSVGYKNASFFKNVFFKKYNMTPGEYRKRLIKE